MRSIRVALLFGACLGLAAAAAHGVELSSPRLLGDLVPGVATVPFTSQPYPLAAAGSRMLFDVYLAGGGTELWSSDGTPQGTERVLPADAGYAVFAWKEGDGAGLLVEEGDGTALLRSDGTAAGTVTVASWPGSYLIGWYGHSDGRTWVAPCYYGDYDYAPDRCELWKVDDGAPGAEKLADDLPLEYQCCSPAEQVIVDGRIFFFTVENGDTTLWRSDGTAASTVPLAHLPPESFVYPLGRGGHRFVFGVDLADGGSQVWSSDGSAEGTREMVQLPSFPWEAGWEWYYRKQGPFFFTARDPATHTTGLWAVGGAGKARRLGSFAQIEGNVQGDVHSIGAGPTTRYLFAAARNPPAPGELARLRLWITDGTPARTMELRGIAGGTLRVEHLYGVAAGRLYFTASDGTSGVEPWTTDGTAAGTRRLADICPGPCSSRLNGVVSIGATALFIAEGGGEQMLWRSDGTSASPVVALTGGTAAFSYVGEPFGPAPGGRAFFTVGAADAFALWATDGTAAGTGPVAPGTAAPLGSAPAPLAVSAQRLLFAAVDPLDDDRRRLYLQRRGEALSGGVRLPEYVRPTAGLVDDARGLALFGAGAQLWSTDGTAGGTVQLTAFGALNLSTSDASTGDKYHDDCESSIELPQRHGDGWLFVAHSCTSGEEVWSTDGSLAGTHRTTLLPDDASAPVLVGDGLFYFATVQSDGGADEAQLFHRPLGGGEAVQLTRRAGGIAQNRSRWAAPALGRLFFEVANDEGSELWASDGTVAGTGAITMASDGTPLTDVRNVVAGPGFALAWIATNEYESTLAIIAPASGAATPLPGLRVLASLGWAASPAGVFFGAWDSQHGWEPWISDGTLAGTRVLDVAPGPASSNPQGFATSDAGVFFTARVREIGQELWIADAGGTSAHLVADLAPGWLSSTPSDLVAGPGGLLFTADDGATGREPWLLEWTPAGTAADPGVR